MTDVFEIDETPLDDNTDYYTDLVGEGKKFKDNNSLAKGKLEADKYVERLVAEKEAMRKDLDKRLTAEELIQKVQEAANKAPVTPTDNQTVSTPSKDVDINKLVDEKFTELERNRVAKDNELYVVNTLQQTLGPDFKIKVNRRAQELGLGPEFVRNLMQTTPNAAIALFVDTTPKGEVFQTPPNTRVNTTGFINKGTSTRDFEYYEKFRKENPRDYWSAKVQQEMFKQAEALGDKFYGA